MSDITTHAAGSPAEPLILTLDIGTSSTRAMLFDAQARAVPGYLAQAPA
jgi:glycerol kinase